MYECINFKSTRKKTARQNESSAQKKQRLASEVRLQCFNLIKHIFIDLFLFKVVRSEIARQEETPGEKLARLEDNVSII